MDHQDTFSAGQEPPDGLDDAGSALWEAVTVEYQLEPHERVLLAEACRLADRVAGLEAVVEREGLMVTGSMGQPRLHPAVAEIRQSRLTLVRVLGGISYPDQDGRPLTAAGRHAQVAAIERWRREPAHGA